MDINDLKRGDSFTEKQLQDRFTVKNNGGIRTSKSNKLVILITSTSTMDYGQKNYKDIVDSVNRILSYTGEGKQNQQMTGNNKSILNSQSNDYRFLYFKKPKPNHLVFQFEGKFIFYLYDIQKNLEGSPRLAIIFKFIIL